MQRQPSTGTAPVQRDLIDPRSSRVSAAPTRKRLLNDPRSTR
jgi:hypothetical protein